MCSKNPEPAIILDNPILKGHIAFTYHGDERGLRSGLEKLIKKIPEVRIAEEFFGNGEERKKRINELNQLAGYPGFLTPYHAALSIDNPGA